MDGRKIVWTHSAIKQRDWIFDYWNRRNKSKAFSQKLNRIIRSRIQLLKKFPELGISTGTKNIRLLVVLNYKIFYKIGEQEVFIVGVWDNRRDPSLLVKFLKGN